MSWQIHHHDVQATPWPIESESVQCVVTSPPYWGLRDYGVTGQLGLERTPKEYIEKMVAVFREVRRVLRKDGTVWLNLGDCFQSKQLVGIPWRVAFALQADGWWLRSDIVWAKPDPMPESIRDRPTRAHEFIFLLTKSERYFYDQDAIAEQSIHFGTDPRSGIGNIRYVSGKRNGAPGQGQEAFATINATRNARTFWTIATEPFPEAHFATFPTELARRCILAGSKPDSLVLDPFCGSGTALLVADTLGRCGVGLELNPAYIEIAEKRIGAPRSEAEAVRRSREDAGQFGLFNPQASAGE